MKVRWIAFVMAHAGIVMKLYEGLMLLVDFLSDFLTYITITNALSINKVEY